ncbi:MAG TPA: type I glyceraldehyde-3-phosphate dehydrogenase [Gemmatimonadota bacterium]|nr:type I glyceraldehyde-3-phosphate dehydrogenase [Gemmatimonadota bacterium]
MRIGINGFGRIGRLTYRALRMTGRDLDLVAVNDLTDAPTLAHLLKYDSVHGRLDADVEVADGKLLVGDDEFRVLSEKDPARLPWGDLGVDVVIESTGRFKDRAQAAQHLEAGAKKVIVSAPAKGADLTVVVGVNDDKLEADHDVLSNASCTTNCLAPVAKVILDTVGWVHGLMTTTHSYTASQHVVDSPDKDLRRARAAAISLIPTTTGAARATGLVLPALEGKIDGMAIRVPTPNVSLVDLTVEVEKETSAEAVNQAFREAAAGRLAGVLDVCEEPLVSVDFMSTTHSSIVDALSTAVIDGTLVKVLSWYDNEMGFSTRLLDLAERLRPFVKG